MPNVYVEIVGVGMAVPKRVVTTERLIAQLSAEGKVPRDTTVDWVLERTGIRERRIGPRGLQCATLGAEASEKALTMAGLLATDIDLILCATETGPKFPSTANEIQRLLGATNATCFDIHAGCAGAGMALMSAGAFITSGRFASVLVVGVDRLSTIMNWRDRTTCVLGGDGGGAVILRATKTKRLFAEVSGSDGTQAGLIRANRQGKLVMAGRDVFKFIVRVLSDVAIPDCLKKAGLTIGDIDLLIPHQSNRRMIEAMAEKLGVPMSRVVMNIDRFGNTSNASTFLCLAEAYASERLKAGMVVGLATGGSGMNWTVAVFEWTI